ncbi:hypothetical protein MNB_SUP05-SYMBIONT-7-545 [hydrothermal vent metagenome]|uniref:Uncharacterized protein n=1 Tax=hydrothermal vent metagenome TaxID=652676 RepID=A0A1W1E5U3_9ZZZZ
MAFKVLVILFKSVSVITLSPALDTCTAKSAPKILGKAYKAESNKKKAISVFFNVEY